MAESECVFCKIVAGTEPSEKVYEDERILAFMDIRPIYPGECMIIPREHIDHFCDIPDELAQHIMLYTQKIARRIQEKFNPLRVGYVVSGFGVPHAHMVLIPMYDKNDVTSVKFLEVQDNKITLNYNLVPFTDRGELEKVAALLRIDNEDQ